MVSVYVYYCTHLQNFLGGLPSSEPVHCTVMLLPLATLGPVPTLSTSFLTSLLIVHAELPPTFQSQEESISTNNKRTASDWILKFIRNTGCRLIREV